MKTFNLRALAFTAMALAYGGTALAAVHAPANSTITNTASVNFLVGGNPQPQVDSLPDVVTVDELVDVDVTLQSASPVATLSAATGQAIRFRVASLGNGSETFDLTADLTLGGDQFDPTGPATFFIDDGDGIFEPGGDDGIAVTSILLAAETFGDVWLVVDIPVQADGDLGNVRLIATDSQGTGVPGSELVGLGDGGVGLVFGPSGGDDFDDGAFQVTDISFTVLKSSSISDPFAGNQPIPGATITYTITVDTTGTGTATSANVQDDVPANTTYVPGSITVNAIGKTDAADAEAAPACDFNISNPGGIFCLLGSLTGITSNTVTFQVTIN